MRKGLEHKYDIHKQELEGRGMIIDATGGAVYQLDIAPDGWCRLWKNALILDGSSVTGKPLYIWDYGTPEKAIAHFESIKKTPGVIWCQDDHIENCKKVLENLSPLDREPTDKLPTEKANKKQKATQTRRRGRPRLKQLTIDDLKR